MVMPIDPISEVFPKFKITEPVNITEEAFEKMSSEKPYLCKYCFKEYRKLEALKISSINPYWWETLLMFILL